MYGRLSSSDKSSDVIFFGSWLNENRFWIANNKKKIYYGWNDNTFRSEYIETNTINTVSLNYLNDRKEYFNEEVIKNNLAQLKANNKEVYIFSANDGSSGAAYKSKIKLYEFKISDGSNIIRDFIPCYRDSDKVIGLYDIVDNVFYINQGSGTFNKGNDENIPIVEENYITSTSKVNEMEDHNLYAVWVEE